MPEEEKRPICQIKDRLSTKFPSATPENVDDAVRKAYTEFSDKNVQLSYPRLTAIPDLRHGASRQQ